MKVNAMAYSRQLVGVSLLLVLVGCGVHITGSGAPPSGLDTATVQYDTQVSIGTCAVAEEPDDTQKAGIAAVLLASAISTGVNRIGAALKAAAKEDRRSVLAKRNIEATNELFECVQVVRAWFYNQPTSDDKGRPNWIANDDENFLTRHQLDVLRNNGLWLASFPNFYFEGRFSADSNKPPSALTIEPAFIRLETPIATRLLRPDHVRGVTVSFAFYEPNEAVDLEDNPGTMLTLGKLSPDQDVKLPTGAALHSGGQSPNPLVRSPHETEWFTLSLAKQPKPLAVGALVTEVQGASEFLQFVADVFSASEEQITTELRRRLIPSEREAAQEEKLSTQEKLESDYDDAFADAYDKVSSCAVGTEGLVKLATGARTALRKLNQASRALKGEEALDDVSGTIPLQGDIRLGCQTALETLQKIEAA